MDSTTFAQGCQNYIAGLKCCPKWWLLSKVKLYTLMVYRHVNGI